MSNPKALEAAKHLLRTEICAHCPRLTRTCEQHCGLFVHLPQLMSIAARRDPMLALPARAQAAATRSTGQPQDPLQQHGEQAVQLIAAARG